jgi:hypothetical protein
MKQTKRLVGMLGAMMAMVVLGAACASGANPEPDERQPPPGGPVNRTSVGAVDRLPGAATALTAAAALDDVGDPPVAADVVAALKRRGRATGEVEAVSEAEARFADTRLAGLRAPPELANGGVVEIKATPADARATRAGLPVVGDLIPLSQQHLVVHARIVLRLSGRFNDEAVDRYAAALRKLRG